MVRVAKGDIGFAAATAGFAIIGLVRLFQNLFGVSRPVSEKRILTISIRSIYETFGLSVRSVVNLYLILESIVLGHWHLLIVQTSLALGLFFMRLRGLSLN